MSSGATRSLLGLLEDEGSNAVHVGDTALGQGLAHGDGLTLLGLELAGADEAGLLELNEAVADVLASGLAVVLGLGAVALLATEVLAEAVDADLLADVELVGNGGGAVVEPVALVGRELVSAGGLDVLGPLQEL